MYTIKKILEIFEADITKSGIIRAENSKNIPSPERLQTGSVSRRVWSTKDLPVIGEKYGFLPKITKPTVITVFTMKGGVLKTTLSLNLARMSALHNIKTIVVGLDLQGDLTNAIGFEKGLEEAESLEQAQEISRSIFGLYDYERGFKSLFSLIQKTDIPTLDFIPETPELHQLDRAISQKNNRESWLTTKVVEQLKEQYDLIIFDCSPNWNNLVTNAITAADLLISPLECKINNFRNYPEFKIFMDEFKEETKKQLNHVFIPTKLSIQRKLSKEIRQWYLKNVPNCLQSCIREGVKGEESISKHLSIPEYAPKSLDAEEMRQVLREIWEYMPTKQNSASINKSSTVSHSNKNNEVTL